MNEWMLEYINKEPRESFSDMLFDLHKLNPGKFTGAGDAEIITQDVPPLDLGKLTHVEQAPDALLVVSRRQTKRYLLFDEETILDGWTNIESGEVKSPYKGLDPSAMRQLAFSGIHVIWPRVFPLLESMPERFGIIDFYLKYCHQCAFLGYEKKDLQLMDVGKLETLDQAEKFFKQI